MNYTIKPLHALRDNFIWTIISDDQQHAVCVDPGDAQPVLDWLQENNVTLTAILITHHHPDHTGGILTLREHFDIPVYGPKNEPISGMTHHLSEGDQVSLPEVNLELNVLDIPGHTLGHITYYNDKLAFTGDTLFSAGCGRVFEGTPEMMLASLDKLAALPESTQIYCGHEYTQANLEFATIVEPNNLDITARRQIVDALRAAGKPSLPNTLGNEFLTNPFLRCRYNSVRSAAETYISKELETCAQVFSVIREWKNRLV